MPNSKRLCTSIPINDIYIDDPVLLKKKLDYAFSKGTDFVELRFDFLSNFDKLDNVIESVGEHKNRSIFTLRPTAEGGKYNMPDKERFEILKQLCLQHPLFVDVEYSLISTYPEIADWIENNDVRILISWHDFIKTPSKEELIDLVNNMRIYSNFIKVVTTANNIDDSITILQLYDNIDTQINLISFAMGELGIISRIITPIIAEVPFSYCALEDAIAPGQLDINQMITIRKLLKKRLLM